MGVYQQTKWLTKNFEGLKGLINLPIALYFLFLAAWNASQSGITPNGKDIGWPMIALLLTILASFWISQLYSRRMGTVKILTRTKIFGLAIALFLLIILVDYLDLYLNKQLSNPISITSLAFAIFFAYPYFKRRQMVYLIFAIMFILLAITPTFGLLPYQTIFNDQYGVWGYLLLGVALFVGGLVDHFTLTKLLPLSQGADNE